MTRRSALSGEDARVLVAVLGTCPDCGGETEVDRECKISVPLLGGARQLRIGAAVLCGGCEFAAEIPTSVMQIAKARR